MSEAAGCITEDALIQVGVSPLYNNKVSVTLICVDLSRTDQHHFCILLTKLLILNIPYDLKAVLIAYLCTFVSISFTKSKDNTTKQ